MQLNDHRYIVLTLASNVSQYVSSFIRTINSFTHKPQRTYILAHDCNDDTVRLLYDNAVAKYKGFTVFEQNSEKPFEGYEHPHELRNLLIDEVLEEQDWNYALLYDFTKLADPNLPEKLFRHRFDISAPLVMLEGFGIFQDTASFRDINGKPFSSAPPFFKGAMFARVKSVGSVMMVKRKVLISTRYGPKLDPSEGDSVSFCSQATQNKFKIWVMRDIAVRGT